MIIRKGLLFFTFSTVLIKIIQDFYLQCFHLAKFGLFLISVSTVGSGACVKCDYVLMILYFHCKCGRLGNLNLSDFI